MILIDFSNIDCFEVSSKFCRTIESSLCFSLRWSQKPNIQLLGWKWKNSACFLTANVLFCVLRWLIKELLKSRTEYPLVSALKLSLVLKLWLLLHETSFFYQLDKDIFFPVAVRMVGQLIELLSAVKLLGKKAGEYLHLFFLAIEKCWCTWSSCLVPVLIAEESVAIITAWSRPFRANLCSGKLSNESFSFL